MPIVKEIISKNQYRIIVWKLTESTGELHQAITLSDTEQKKYQSLSEKRKREYLGIRRVMKKMGIEEEILYDEKGKPYLEDNFYISFSHSYEMVVVAASKYPIGVDVELRRDEKIQAIEKKFIREDEQSFLPTDIQVRNEYLHVIWGIKEGLYKLNGGNLWNFLHYYKVEPFELEESKPIKVWVLDPEGANKYIAFYETIENYYLICTIDILDY